MQHISASGLPINTSGLCTMKPDHTANVVPEFLYETFAPKMFTHLYAAQNLYF
jgi:hypothetical protein